MDRIIPRIREATAADLPACAAIINDYIDEMEGWLPRTKTRAEISALFASDILTRRVILFAEDMSGPVGYLSLAPEGFVAAIYLVPRARGQGVGLALLNEAKRRHPAGLELTVYEPNRDAQRFYAREGFVEVPDKRDDDTEKGVPTLWLRWNGGAVE
jgi:putative acetyltransferase